MAVSQPEPVFQEAETFEHEIWSLERLELAVAAGLVATTVLPWLQWGMASGGITLGFSLIDALTTRGVDSGTVWLATFFVGALFAVAGSVWETVVLPEGRTARGIALAGFGIALTAAMLGLMLAPGTMGSGNSRTFESTLDVGYWAALGVDVLGCAVATFYFREPANPLHGAVKAPHPAEAAPVAPQPDWPAPDYIGHTGYPEHVGSAADSSYGPPVFPGPGHLTPAYLPPGQGEPGAWAVPESLAGVAAVSPEMAPVRGKSAGRLVLMADGQRRNVTVQPGERLLVGRDPDAQLRVQDPSVSPRHVTIERRGDGWVVQEIDAVNITRLTDRSGMTRPVRGETPVESGQLTAGHVTISLLANEPGLMRD